ncbi:AI-2E family transporter [Marivirga atlantica]|jgi:predicted PurR-regulated permease PerM|uniref:AI-2E family transporter n=1 Tax=Marivirga atlantica TaxID=1548457 RepID=A0A937AHT2_9BACT|nr:AI-2E family transporter [Marivirga atlantica]MBL0767011.1 AI-2E family transporter [Marivirga atlantica]
MEIRALRTTNRLLFILALPVLFYSLQLLSFIFVPLFFAFFLALLFSPLMRWFTKNRIPKTFSLALVIAIIVLVFFSCFKVIQLSGQQMSRDRGALSVKFEEKVEKLVNPFSNTLGIEKSESEGVLEEIINSTYISDLMLSNVSVTFTFLRLTIVNTLMTLFFLVLFLAGSMNLKQIIQTTLFYGNTRAIKTFIEVESSISKFLKVKIVISLLTGIAFGIIAWALGISFPILWGVLAFVINFIQMVGSVISTVLVMLFAYIEIDNPGTLVLAAFLFSGAQVLFGAVLEPIFMGKTFSINIIVVLVMLMFWGYLWGIAGLILAIPLTVLLKIVLLQYESTRKLATLMS